jgi:hypothetical protein
MALEYQGAGTFLRAHDVKTCIKHHGLAEICPCCQWLKKKFLCNSSQLVQISIQSSSSSSAFALAWRNYSPRSITPP